VWELLTNSASFLVFIASLIVLGFISFLVFYQSFSVLSNILQPQEFLGLLLLKLRTSPGFS